MKKTMRSLLVSALSLVIVLAAFAALAEGESYKIGILQYVEHPALDASVQGFKDALTAGGLIEGENVTYDPQNPSADAGTMQLMAAQLVGEGNQLLLAVATPAVQALSAATQQIPILGTAVTDYVGAQLVASNEAPGINVSGTTDMNPIDKQVALITQLVPGAKTVGILYTSSEPNSQIQADLVKLEAEKLGLAVEVKTIAAVGEVQQAAEALAGLVDVIYVPTDNVCASAITVIVDATLAAKKPVIVGEANMCKGGALATIGLDYYKLGFQTGNMALRILKEGANPAEMPIEALEQVDLYVNKTTAAALGIEIPADMLSTAIIFE